MYKSLTIDSLAARYDETLSLLFIQHPDNYCSHFSLGRENYYAACSRVTHF